jgi:hypothetical protein
MRCSFECNVCDCAGDVFLFEYVHFTAAYSVIATSLMITLAFLNSYTTSTLQLQHFVINPPAADFCSENAGG